MRVGEDDFRRRYAELSDEALLTLDREQLVYLARACYDDELNTRGLHREPEPVRELTEEPTLGDDEMLSAETFLFLDEAELAREFLQSAGITCYIENENALRMIWAWSYFLGGLRLMVPASMLLEANAILAETCSHEELTRAAGIEEDGRVGFDADISRFPLHGRGGWRTKAVLVLAILCSPSVDRLQLIYVWLSNGT